MKENPYFKLNEFKCKCGKCTLPPNCPPDEMIDILVEIREHYGKPVIINSGYRCKEHNAKIGGAPSSRHTYGDAIDFTVKGVPTKEVYNYVISKYDDRPYGIAYRLNKDPFLGFIHLDVRKTKRARWVYPGSYDQIKK